MTELIVIMVVALIVIGPKRLPELARTLGKALGDFKRATSDFQNSFSMEDDYDLDVLDEEAKQSEKKTTDDESQDDEPEDEDNEAKDDVTQADAEPNKPETQESTSEAKTAATENEAAEKTNGPAQEDEKQT